MKILRWFICVVCFAAGVSRSAADIYTYNFASGFAGGGAIPDGNPTGWFDTRTLSGIANSSIADVNVTLNISGGFNGDFYAYLSHESGFSVLLNRVGRSSANPFGYGNAGLNLTLDDTAATGDIHGYQSVSGFSALIGNGSVWSPDGRNVSPLLSMDTHNRTHLLNQFNGLDPNGSWTLFVADLSNGAQGAVVGWGLNITAVPEPSSLGLMTLGLLMLRRKFRRA